MPSQALSLLKNLAEASQAQQTFVQDKEELVEQIKKVRSITEQPQPEKNQLKNELSKLEEQLKQVLNMEQQILTKESADVDALRNELKELRFRLALSNSPVLQKSIERILFLVGELSARVETYMSMKNQREARLVHIEKQIRESLDCNFEEIINIEEKIQELEERYHAIKKTTTGDKKHLLHIEEQLNELHKKLLDKKTVFMDKGISSNEEKEPELKEEVLSLKDQLLSGIRAKMITRPVDAANPRPQHKLLFPEAVQQSPTENANFPLFREKTVISQESPTQPRRDSIRPTNIPLPPPLPSQKKASFGQRLKRLFGK